MDDFLNQFLNNLNNLDLSEIIKKILNLPFSLNLFKFQYFPAYLKTIINFASSTNLVFFLIIFFVIFFLVKTILKLVQQILSLITTFWLTILVIYFLIKSGLFSEIFKLFNQFF